MRRALHIGCLLVLTGCATGKKVVFSPEPAQPLVRIEPVTPRIEPPASKISSQAEPIYRNPIIEEVEMAPYINDEGNLVFPGKVLVLREPGRWNLEAAQKNKQYFVPAENQPPHLAPPSKSYYDYIQSKKNGAITSKFDVSKVRVTGYTQKEDRQEAQQTLHAGETLAFDPFLGWLAIPAEEFTTPPPVRSQRVNPAPQAEVQERDPSHAPEEDTRTAELKAIIEQAFQEADKASNQSAPEPTKSETH